MFYAVLHNASQVRSLKELVEFIAGLLYTFVYEMSEEATDRLTNKIASRLWVIHHIFCLLGVVLSPEQYATSEVVVMVVRSIAIALYELGYCRNLVIPKCIGRYVVTCREFKLATLFDDFEVISLSEMAMTASMLAAVGCATAFVILLLELKFRRQCSTSVVSTKSTTKGTSIMSLAFYAMSLTVLATTINPVLGFVLGWSFFVAGVILVSYKMYQVEQYEIAVAKMILAERAIDCDVFVLASAARNLANHAERVARVAERDARRFSILASISIASDAMQSMVESFGNECTTPCLESEATVIEVTEANS